MTEALGPGAFWSYTHDDDTREGQRVTRLARRISDEYSLLTGENLELFVDRSEVKWGMEWRRRIDEALQATTFFVPIITPGYFRSTECRSELLKFVAAARSLGVEDLVLPIRYVQVANLNADNPDEAVSLVARMQYADWQDLRLEEEDSAAYRKAVNALAIRLVELSDTVDRRPATTAIPTASAAPGVSLDPYNDSSPGFTDLMDGFEELLERWNDTIHEFPAALEAFTEVVTEAGGRLKDKPFAHRIRILRALASDLDAPANRIAELGERYAAELFEIDPRIRAVLELALQVDRSSAEWASATQMSASMRGLIDASRTAGEHLRDVFHEMRKAARQSRDLRPPLGRVEAGLRGVTDGQAIMDEWLRMLDELDDGDTGPS